MTNKKSHIMRYALSIDTKIDDLELLTSPVKWPFDTPGAISCRCLIVTESVSPAIFEIMGPKRYWGHELDLSRPRDVIDHVTNRFAICHFLLLSHWNRGSIFNRLRDIRPVPCALTRRYTDTQTHAASDLYSVPCSILHWTQKSEKISA